MVDGPVYPRGRHGAERRPRRSEILARFHDHVHREAEIRQPFGDPKPAKPVHRMDLGGPDGPSRVYRGDPDVRAGHGALRSRSSAAFTTYIGRPNHLARKARIRARSTPDTPCLSSVCAATTRSSPGGPSVRRSRSW